MKTVLAWLAVAIAVIVTLPFVIAAWCVQALRRHRRAVRAATAYDQLANAVLGGNEDETISSRAAKARLQGRRWACLLCRVLDRIDPNHCEKFVEPDRGDPWPPIV